MLAAATDVAKRAAQAGKVACTLGITGEAGRLAHEQGFRLIALGSDFNYLSSGANAIVAASKG